MNTASALILLAVGTLAHATELEERALKFTSVDDALDGTVLAKGEKPAPKKAAPPAKKPGFSFGGGAKKAAPAKAPPPKEGGGGFDFGQILANLGGGVTPAVPAKKPAAATIFGRKKSRAMPEERVSMYPQPMRVPMTMQRPTMQRPLVIRGPLQLVAESFSDPTAIIVFLASACVGAALTFMAVKRFLAVRSTSASERLLTVTS